MELAYRFGERVPWREMVSQRYRLDDADEALAAVASRDVVKAVIVPTVRG